MRRRTTFVHKQLILTGELTAAREKYGPHAERFIRVYANGLAEESLRSGGTRFRRDNAILPV